MEYKSCFILMPFTKANELEKDDLDFIYSHIIQKAVQDFEVEDRRYFDRVERFNGKVGSIISGIVNQLNSADLVIADLTALNPNVMYELGVRHSLRRGTIIISQDLKNLPSDLRDYLTVEYKYSTKTVEQAKNYEIFRADLHKTIFEVISTQKYDSPVLSYLQQRQQFRNEDLVDKFKENIIAIMMIVRECNELRALISSIEQADSEEPLQESMIFQLFNFRLNNLIAAINELRIYDSSPVFQSILNAKTLLTEMSKMFAANDMLGGLKGIPGMPEGLYGLVDIRSGLQKQYINPFTLATTGEIEHVSMTTAFVTGGALESNFINIVTAYLDKRGQDLAVHQAEIDALLSK
jgi:hypothetical protein